jgi:hypothetical protein
VSTEKLRYIVARLRGLLRPPVTVVSAPAVEVVFEEDVAVAMRDGTILRVNVFRPRGAGAHPAILCAHPYGKDNLPTPKRGSGFRPSIQYRIFRMPEPVSFSNWTGWEAPDPAHWVPRGYAVVNCDLRGCGNSDGVGDLVSPAGLGHFLPRQRGGSAGPRWPLDASPQSGHRPVPGGLRSQPRLHRSTPLRRRAGGAAAGAGHRRLID